MTAIDQTVLQFSQALVTREANKGTPITHDVIGKAVDKAMLVSDIEATAEHRDAVIRELETRFAIWIGTSVVLADDSDHHPWLPTRRTSIAWLHWDRYRTFLEQGMAPSAVGRLHETTDDILGRLEDSERKGAWSRRGLVVGHVQSGKTANYTGLICKAADAGYKVIIVLAGMHKNLRSQTQVRLDEGFLGYKTGPVVATNSPLKPVGVGLIDPSVRPDSITNRSDDGDFKTSVARAFAINPGGKPLLFVIKKNATVLKNLLGWVEWAATGQDAATGMRMVRGVPLLVIDDEADHGSIDTKDIPLDENGQPDEEHDPVAINRYIRQLLHHFDQNAYVGYTATPFANIYIHESARTIDCGDDLFPRSFIVNLPAPSNYFGPVRLFGSSVEEADEASSGNPLIRHIEDVGMSQNGASTAWMPTKHKIDHRPRFKGADQLPPSLSEAIKAFILASAARVARGQGAEHRSMLIHVTRFTRVQGVVAEQVRQEVGSLVSRWRNGDGQRKPALREEFKTLWEGDFRKTSCRLEDDGAPDMAWDSVEPHVWPILDSVKIKEINGTAGDVLDYEEHRSTGLTVIAIGGDKLARGLTLEGLTVSYFLRASRMYDTLMQMGRWFGYRPEYSDLCRLYLTKELEDWYRVITAASEELRHEFDVMAAAGETPRTFGLKVRLHPLLMVTSAVKSRHGTKLRLSFAGNVSETVAFDVTSPKMQGNIAATRELLKRCGPPDEFPVKRTRPGGRTESWSGTRLWAKVDGETVARFLESYHTHPASYRADSALLARFLRQQMAAGELKTWTVALMGGGEGGTDTTLGLDIEMVKRAGKVMKHKDGDYPAIRRLLSPKDEAIDLDAEQYERALAITRQAFQVDPGRSKRTTPPDAPNGIGIRSVRQAAQGLLLLYPINLELPPEDAGRSDGLVIGFGVSFPVSGSASTVDYTVNNTFYRQELGEEE